MIHPQRLAHVLIVVLVLCSACAHAQTPARTAEADKELQEKALNLLESAAGQVNVLQSAENRARIAANIMESIWTHDEKRARSLLVLIENDIKETLNREDPNKPKDQHRFRVFLKLRADTIDRIAIYDPELALAFLKSTQLAAPELPNHIVESERALELNLAKKIGPNNPELALKIARESLARGVSDDLLVVLRRLSKKHKDEARTLYKEIVNKLKDVNLRDDWQTKNFVQRLVLSFTPPETDPVIFRELVSLLVTKALDSGCRRREVDEYNVETFCRWVVSSLASMSQSDPRVAELNHWATQEYSSSAAYYELDMAVQGGSVDEILELREKYPRIEGNISWRAFEMAVASGDLDKARTIANSSANAEVRKTMLARFDDSSEAAKEFNRELVADIQRKLNERTRTEERLMLLLSVADQVAATDRSESLKLLNQAVDIADTLQPGWQQTGVIVGIAIMYCQLKDDRCFQLMEPLVPKLNQLVDAAARLDGFDTQYLRDGEWNMSANGRIGELLTGLANHAGFFAWNDFDRAVSLSSQFERTEIRLMAQVKIAQSILNGPPQPLSGFVPRYRH